MKKIKNIVIILIMVDLAIITILLIRNDFMQKVNVQYRFNEDNHVLCKGEYLTTEERKALNDILSSNHEVLLLFADENSLTDDNDISDIISNYTKKDNVPYVIFKYSNNTRTLSSISSENVEFNDIYLKNVDYSYVYKYIPLAKSLNLTSYAKFNFVETGVVIFCIVFILLSIFIFVGNFYELIKWHKDWGLLYKLSFKEDKLIIKIDENDKEFIVKKVEYNSEIEQDNDYIMINLRDIIRVTYNDGSSINLKYNQYWYRDFGRLDWSYYCLDDLTFDRCLDRK